MFDDEGRLIDIIGQRGEGPGEFNAPTHIALSNGRLYVTDTLNARIQVLDLNGEPISMIGKRGLYLGNLTRPKGVTVDADDNIYVVESYYDHLLVFDKQGQFLLPIGGTGDNLKAAIAGETHEYTDMYPGMAKAARDEGFDEIADWFETLAKAERSHANRFQKALESLED